MKKCFILALFNIIILISLLAACQDNNTPSKVIRHATGNVQHASFNNKGSLALVAPDKLPAGLWELNTKKLLYTWKNSKAPGTTIIATAFSPDGNYAATAERRNVALWDVTTGDISAYWSVNSDIQSIAVSRQGHYVLIGLSNGHAEYVEMTNGASTRTFIHHARINSVALSNDGRYALTGSDDKTATLWDIQTGNARVFQSHKDKVILVALSPTNSLALSSDKSGNTQLWRLEDEKKRNTLTTDTLSCARFSPSGKFLATSSSTKLTLWNTTTGKPIHHWTLPKNGLLKRTTLIRAITFTPKETTLITEDANGNSVRWDL